MADVLDAPSLYSFIVPVHMSSTIYLFGYWMLSVFLTFIMDKYSIVFREMNLKNKRNTITYVMELIGTSISFIMLTFWFPRIVSVTDIVKPFTEKETLILSSSISLVYYLYIFEVIYKASMNFQLLAHHVLTIVMTFIVCAMLWDTRHPSAVYPIIMVYAAITEQPVFVALLLYRLKCNCHKWFMTACVTGVVFKTFVFCMVWVVVKKSILDVEYANSGVWKDFMLWTLSVSNVCIYIIQIYSVRIYWVLGMKSKKNFENLKVNPANIGTPTPDSVTSV